MSDDMRCRQVLYSLLLFLAVTIAGCQSPDVASDETNLKTCSETPQNLVVISLDTLRSDRLGCYGYPLPTSPFIDELSRRHIVMEDVLAQNPSTILSHRAIFTGQYLFQQQKGPAPADKTMAGIFSKAGYRTAGFTDGGLMAAVYGNDPGFEEYNDQGGGFRHIIDRGLNWLDHQDDRPFFLFLHTYDIHYPYTPEPPFDNVFLPAGTSPYHLGADHGQEYWNSLSLSRNEFIWISRRYDGGVRSADAQMKRFWSELRARNLLKNTVVAVISDHGESLGERGYVGHRQLYDVQLRVPWLLILPENKVSRIITGAVETIDILPTLLDRFALAGGPGLKGRSIMELVRTGKNWSDQRPRLSETASRAFRMGPDWKLILRENATRDEVYSLVNDPEEDHNKVQDQPEERNELTRKLMTFTNLDENSVRKARHRHQVPVMLMQKDADPAQSELMKQLKELGYMQ